MTAWAAWYERKGRSGPRTVQCGCVWVARGLWCVVHNRGSEVGSRLADVGLFKSPALTEVSVFGLDGLTSQDGGALVTGSGGGVVVRTTLGTGVRGVGVGRITLGAGVRGVSVGRITLGVDVWFVSGEAAGGTDVRCSVGCGVGVRDRGRGVVAGGVRDWACWKIDASFWRAWSALSHVANICSGCGVCKAVMRVVAASRRRLRGWRNLMCFCGGRKATVSVMRSDRVLVT